MKRSSIALAFLAGIATIAAVLHFARPQEPESRKAARIAYGEKQWTRAFNEASRRLREDPKDADARLLQARSAARIERDAFALESYGQLPKRPEHAEDLYLVGSILIRMGRGAEGEELLTRAVDTDPAHGEAAGFLSQFLFRNRRFEAAGATARKRLAANPADDATRVLLARIHDATFEPETVIRTLEDWLARNPRIETSPTEFRIETIRKLIARNHLRLHEPEKAITSLGNPDRTDRESLWLVSRARLQLGDKAGAVEFLEAARNATGEAGNLEEPSPYVGAASCRECHAEIFDDQQSSRHAMTFRFGDQPAGLPWNGFAKPDFHSEKLKASFDTKKTPLSMTFESDGEQVHGLVKFIMGSGRHAVTPVIEPEDGSGPRESRWTWYAPVNDWDITPGQPRVPASPLDLMGVAQTPDMIRLCLGCHTTNPSEILKREGRTLADRGIGCERCHGPGGNHIEAIRAEIPDKAIGRFRRNSMGTRPQVMQACGECHGTMGRDLATGSDAAVVRFQAMTLTFSECYKQGQGMRNGFDCLTCHSPHHDAETDPRHYDTKCIECHKASDAAADNAVNEAKASLCKIEPAGNCVSCHMPKIPSVQPHTRFTDHQIRIPKK